MKTCSIDGCGRKSIARGWCPRHYDLWRNNGSPLVAKRAENGALAAFIESAIVHKDETECLIWPYGNVGGYGEILVDGKMLRVTRIVCAAVHGPAPTPEHQAAHSCGNGDGGCTNPHHLRWATPTENNQDKFQHDTHNRGSRHWNAKIGETDVLEIRRLAGKVTQVELAERYGLSLGTIGGIVRRRYWAWLEEAA